MQAKRSFEMSGTILRYGCLCPRHGSMYSRSRSIDPLVLDVAPLQLIYPAERSLDILRIGQFLPQFIVMSEL
jgi:hypothetical protein